MKTLWEKEEMLVEKFPFPYNIFLPINHKNSVSSATFEFSPVIFSFFFRFGKIFNFIVWIRLKTVKILSIFLEEHTDYQIYHENTLFTRIF